MSEHHDVAAYALGVLDRRDSDRFEEHLAGCGACAAELESMLDVVDLLADVDADSMVAAERSRRDGAVLNGMIRTVGSERRQARSRRLFALAAAAVLIAALTGGALLAGGRWLAPAPSTPVAGSSTGTPWDRLPPAGGPGIGGPELAGERFSATDPRTGVHADVILEEKAWGTQVSFALSKVDGPLRCRLVAVRTSGATEVLSSWAVPEEGYGTAAQPQPLALQAATALPRADIAHVQVQALDERDVATTLVTVPG